MPKECLCKRIVRTAEVCSYLRESSNVIWSGFAALYGGQGLVVTDDCEECRQVYGKCVADTGVMIL